MSPELQKLYFFLVVSKMVFRSKGFVITRDASTFLRLRVGSIQASLPTLLLGQPHALGNTQL